MYLSANSIATAKFGALVPTDNVLQRGTDDKVLLLQAQFFALEEIVVWVQHLCDVFGDVAIENGL